MKVKFVSFARVGALALTLLAVLLATLPAFGAVLVLDPSFSADGIQTFAAAGKSMSFRNVAVDSIGRLVFAGYYLPGTAGAKYDFLFWRLLANGDVDTAFGTSGTGRFRPDFNGGSDLSYGLLLDANDRIIAAGVSAQSNGGNLALCRLTPAGDLDPTFGVDGKVLTPIPGLQTSRPPTHMLVRQVVSGVNKLVVVANGQEVTANGIDFVVARYNESDGSLDTSFGGGDGLVYVHVAGIGDAATAVSIAPDNKIVVGGYSIRTVDSTKTPVDVQYAVVRLNEDGSVDTSFGTNGRVTLNGFGGYDDRLTDLVVMPDNRVLLTGFYTYRKSFVYYKESVIARLKANGDLDTTLGGVGWLKFSMVDSTEQPRALLYFPSGKFALSGLDGSGRVFIGRFNANGTPDITFNGGAAVWRYNVVGITSDQVYAMIRQPDGRFVLAGNAKGPAAGQLSGLALRLNINEQPVAGADSYTVEEGSTLNVSAPGILGNDTDDDLADILSAVKITDPSHASSFTLNPDGSFTYTPLAQFNGTDTFVYRAQDNRGASSVDTVVSINVTSQNNPPVHILPAAVSFDEDTPFVFSGGNLISVSDQDAGAGLLDMTLSVAQGLIPTGRLTLAQTTGLTFISGANNSASMTVRGTLSDLNSALGNGSSYLTYVPQPDFFTCASLPCANPVTLTISTDDRGNTGGPAEVTTDIAALTINAVNDTPVMSAMSNINNLPLTDPFYFAISPPACSWNFSLTASDADAGTNFIWSIEQAPAGGSLPAPSLSGAGDSIASFTYTAPTPPRIVETFIIRASDGVLYDEITVHVACNNAPAIQQPSPSITVEQDSVASSPLSLSATDADSGDALTLDWNILTPAAHGTAALTSACQNQSTCGVTYTPNSGFNGSDTFVVRVQDNFAGVDVVTVSVTVTPKVFTLKLFSVANHDGYILESSENSNKGGAMNSGGTTLYVGDDAARKQYRAFLSFNATGKLPPTANIVSAKLRLRRQGIIGTNPFNTHGNLLVDMRKPYFGPGAALSLTDFNTTASKLSVANIPNTTNRWYTLNLPASAFNYIQLNGITQFRLRFAKDDDGDAAADYIKLFSGNSAAGYKPEFTIQYTLPSSE